jgi:rod shape-determining protein MreD
VIGDGHGALVARTSLLIIVVLTLQVTVVANLRVAGVQGDLMLLIGIAAGISGSAERGAVHGFVAGIAHDLLLPTPFGLSALAYALTGHLAGLSRDAVLRSAWWIPVGTAAAASAAGAILYVVLGQVVGQDLAGRSLVAIVAVTAVLNAVVAPVMIRAVRWSVAADDGPRIGGVLR